MRKATLRPDERKSQLKIERLSGSEVQGQYHRRGERLIGEYARNAQIPQHRDGDEAYRVGTDEIDWGRPELN